MTDDSTTVAELPQRDTGRRHRWGAPVAVIGDTHSGCQETHRTCELCRLVKITVHPPQGNPWRAWRTADGNPWQGDATPPCLDRVGA